MASYRVNGYDIEFLFGLSPDGDKTTANSFEKPASTVEVFTRTWEDGVVEYDLLAPIQLKPRTFVIKAKLVCADLATYLATQSSILTLFREAYVTLEQIETGIKANARLSSEPSWDRLTNLDGVIIAACEFRFDEVLQTAAFKEFGLFSFSVDDNMDLNVTQPESSIYNFALSGDGHLILTI